MVCPTEIDENVVLASDILAVLHHLQYRLACHGRGVLVEWRVGSISRGHLGRADTVDLLEYEI